MYFQLLVNFNTSYVVIKPAAFTICSNIDKHFNTSYVCLLYTSSESKIPIYTLPLVPSNEISVPSG